jgi:hypothetical protein
MDAARSDAVGPTAPRQVGTAGGSLTTKSDTSWATNAAVVAQGHAGEVKTGHALDKGLPDGVTILHDITIPGSRANIDHAVVSGTTITLIDAKQWAAGFYWTAGGKTRRGLARFEPAEKKTMVDGAKRIGNHLARAGVAHEFNESVVVVWSNGPASLWAASFPGARLINGATLRKRARRLCGSQPADAELVAALAQLVR